MTSRLTKLPSRIGTNKDLKYTSGLATETHTYGFPGNLVLDDSIRALLDYWMFIDLIEYHGGSDNFADIHRKMAEFMTTPQLVRVPDDQKVYRRLMLVPRGHLKTTLTVAYILWRLYRNPNIRILVATATKDLSLQIVKQCKQLLESEYLCNKVWNNRPHVEGAMIPTMDRGQTYARRRKQRQDLVEDNTDTQAEDKKIVWRADAIQVIRPTVMKEPSLMATSTGSNITGMHFDLVIMDDIINDDTCATPEKMDKTREWAGDVESILDPPRSVVCGEIGDFKFKEYIGDEQIVIGTRYAKGDYYEYLEEEKEKLEYDVFFRNIYKNGIDDSDGFIWEEKFNQLYVSRLRKRLTTRRFGSQYLNSIITSEEQILDASLVQYFASAKVEVIDRKARVYLDGDIGVDIFPYLVVDPAISQSKKADNTVILVGGVDFQRNLYILDFFCGKVTPYPLVEKLFELADKWECRAANVEVVAFQQSLIYMIKQKFNDYHPITLLEYRPKGDKKARIETHLEPLFQQRKIYLPHWASNHPELQQEIYYFPAQNVHDDILDAMAMLYEIATPTPDRKRRKSNATSQVRCNSKYGGYR